MKYPVRSIVVLTLLVSAVLGASAAEPASGNMSWRTRLDRELPLLGHRNWIVVADAAYPWQTASGIETIYTGEDQLTVVKAVLDALSRARHVKPIIYTDAELAEVPESDAKGVTEYRDKLKKSLDGHEAKAMAHDEIIKKLDEAGKTFHVLLLKTRLTIPYTSVFLQLDCGYWNADSEKKLRDAIK